MKVIRASEVEKECEYCGKLFVSYKSANRKFCSERCFRLGKHREPKFCIICGKMIHGNALKYCSMECRTVDFTGRKKPYLLRRVIKKCETCGKEMECGGRAKHKRNARFCSNKCSAKSKRNSITGFWNKNGNTSCVKWKEYRLEIIKDYGGKCALCGKKTGLQIHHIIPRELGGKHEKENLLPVCVKCHRSLDAAIALIALKNTKKDTITNVLQFMELLQ